MKPIFSALESIGILGDVSKWISEHSLSISIWGMLTAVLSKVLQITSDPSMIILSLTDVTLVMSFIIAVLTILIKAKEFVLAYFPKLVKRLRNKKK